MPSEPLPAPPAPGALSAAAPPPRFALRMWLFFFGYFLFGGVALPFFPVWLQARGLSEVEIAQVIALPTLIRVFLTPLAGIYADRAPNRRFAAITFTLPAVFIFLLAWPAHTFWTLLVSTGVAFTLYALALPPAEALALTGVRRFGLDYGRMRMGGSIAFITANLTSGALLSYLGTEWIFVFILFVLSTAAGVSFIMPVTPKAIRALDDADKPDTRPSREVLGNRSFIMLMIAANLIQASHALLYSFGSIEWTSLGYASWQIGAFWAFSLACEISLFIFAKPLLRAFGPYNLLLMGGAAAVVRWVSFPLVVPLGFFGFAATMALHGLTFGANYLGTQQLIARHVPERMTASAQGILAMAAGLGMAIATSAAGPIYHALGINGFFLMAPVAAAGLALFVATRKYARS